jgi:parvulin-like peptidyl-prolyl isomerase
MSALSNIRNGLNSSGSSIIVGILIFGLVATFGGFIGSSGSLIGNDVFSVNGKSISQGEYSLEYNRINNIIAEQQNSIDPKLLDEITKESISLKELNYQSSLEAGFNLSDEQINQVIRNDQSFYLDGKFDVDLFRGFLSRLGMTPADFRELVKSRVLAAELSNFIDETSFLTNKYSRDFVKSSKQSRDITFLKLSSDIESEKENITSLEIETFYQENKYQYIDPKKVSYSFLKINAESFALEEISDEEILMEKEALEEGISTQTRVSHIELAYSEENRDLSLSKAEDIINLINESPDQFSRLAKEFSTDIGTKDIGGDLGFTDGNLFPDEFETVIASLKIDEFSKIIDLGSSLHILKVTERNKNSFTNEEIKEKINYAKSIEKLDSFISDFEISLEVLNIDKISDNLDLNKTVIVDQSINQFLQDFGNIEALEELENNTLDLSLTYGPVEINDSYYFFNFTNIKDEGFLPLNEVENLISSEIKKVKFLSKLDQIILTKKEELSSNPKNYTSYAELQRGNSLLPFDVTDQIFSLSSKDTNPVALKSSDGDTYIIKLEKINRFDDIISSEEVANSKTYLDNIFKRVVLDSFNESLKADAKIN